MNLNGNFECWEIFQLCFMQMLLSYRFEWRIVYTADTKGNNICGWMENLNNNYKHSFVFSECGG